jgi:hypothetical protein
MKKKSDAAYTWVQDETAEIANTGYRLKTIYQQNKTVPRKYLTRKLEFSFSGSLYLEKERRGTKESTHKELVFSCLKKNQNKTKTSPTTVLNTSLSYFDAAWARAREIRLHPDTTIAIQKEVCKLFLNSKRGEK